MSVVTILAMSGGVGATTLAALAYLGDAQRARGEPALKAHDYAALAERCGAAPATPARPDMTIYDAGRATGDQFTRGISAGTVALVTAATPLGAAVVDDFIAARVALTQTETAHESWKQSGPWDQGRGSTAEAAGRILQRVHIIRVGVFGAYRPRRSQFPVASDLTVPFDPLLEEPGPVLQDPSQLATATSSAIDRWIHLARSELIDVV